MSSHPKKQNFPLSPVSVSPFPQQRLVLPPQPPHLHAAPQASKHLLPWNVPSLGLSDSRSQKDTRRGRQSRTMHCRRPNRVPCKIYMFLGV